MENSNEYLNKKKFRLEDLIKNNNKSIEIKTKLDKQTNKNNIIKNSDSSSESDEEIKNYKILISGKINVNNLLSNKNKLNELKDKEKLQAHLDNEKLKKINLKNILTKSHPLGFLPDPTKNYKNKSDSKMIFDTAIVKLYFFKFQSDSDFFKNINSKLINPDNLNIPNNDDSEINQSNFNNVEINKNSNIVDLNVNELTDKNWELNYFSKMQRKELVKKLFLFLFFYLFLQYQNNNIGDVSKDHRKSNHIKSMISDYKADREINEDYDLKIKSAKLSAKQKYGWQKFIFLLIFLKIII